MHQIFIKYATNMQKKYGGICKKYD
jgi:hypothetical protein